MNFKISFREFWGQRGQLFLYILSLVLSLGVFLALDSVQVNLNTYIEQEKQNLVGADIKVSSRRAFSSEVQTSLDQIKENYSVADIYEFSSMIRTESDSLLSQIKVVSPTYPLYGTVELQSGKDLKTQLTTGKVIVESGVLDRLSVQVGDTISVGKAQLTISDVILFEPDKSVNLFNIGPRVLISTNDLEALGLVGDKSRVSYQSLIKIPKIEAQTVVLERLEKIIEKPEKVVSLDEAETPLSRFSGRFLLFLKLVIFSLLILTGIGIITILKAFLQSQRMIIALRKSLGETTRDIIISYLQAFSVWTSFGLFLAIIMAWGFIKMSDTVLLSVLPVEIEFNLSFVSVLKTFLLGICTSLFFALFSLSHTVSLSPGSLFHFTKENLETKHHHWKFLFSGILLYGIFIFFELENIKWSLIFIGSILGLFFIFWGFALFVLHGFKKFDKRINHQFRLVIRSLNRAGSTTALFLGVFTVSLTVIFSIIIMENTIQKQFVFSYPENAPNIFLLDIKRDQVDELSLLMEKSIDFYPVIRAQLVQANNQSMEQLQEASGGFDSLRRLFNLTYYEKVLDTEKIIESVEKNELFASTQKKGIVPVSVLDMIADDLKVEIGSLIEFNIQGVEIVAQVTSLRTRLDSSPSPFFYFVFPSEVLEKAPQTLFATGQIDLSKLSNIQNQIAKKFPQISTVDISSVTAQVGDILRQISGVTRFFMLFNLFVGLIIFVASLMATSEDRKQEAVFYRLQGMTMGQVWQVLFYEFLFIGIFTVGVGIFSSNVVASLVLSYLFDLSLSALPVSIYGYGLGLFGCVFLIGFLILYVPLKENLIQFLRENFRE